MRLALAFCLALLAGPAAAGSQRIAEGRTVEGLTVEGLTTHYTCEGGAHLPVAYVNTPAGDSYAVLVYDGRMAVLKAGITGSGVRYVSVDGTQLVWHVKGQSGFLAHDDADETMILPDCTAR
ncbi:MAG: MliC family protein [Amaricoccus sp.]|uniref:MliC family protein n=1 Tax=Amaricoccus sp. TaxID=1872485 RepID=UPI0039E4A5B4